MNYLRSLFGKRHSVNLIREGSMYRLTFHRGQLIKEERIEAFGGYTGLNEVAESEAVGDRSRTDLYRPAESQNKVNFTKEPEVL